MNEGDQLKPEDQDTPALPSLDTPAAETAGEQPQTEPTAETAGEQPQTEPAAETAGEQPQTEPAAPAAPPSRPARASVDLGSWEHFGFVDEEEQLRQRDGELFKGRVIGSLKGRTLPSAVAPFLERFNRLEQNVRVLERDLESTENKGRLRLRVDRAIQQLATADALGDFDRLLSTLHKLDNRIREYQDEQRRKKDALVARAEEVADSTDWKATSEKLKRLQAEWKGLGSAGRQDDEMLWQRFRGLLDGFFQRRDEDRRVASAARDEARARKEALCAEAEQLAESTEWATTASAMNDLMEQWKSAGWAGREGESQLWTRFRAARSLFFERRKTHHAQLRDQRDENRRRKEALCEEAESLGDATDLVAACDQVRALQAEWKSVGAVPRAISDRLWERFRAACDAVFARSHSERGRRKVERPKTREESVTRKREQAEGLRESIARDLGHLDRWRQALASLSDSGRAEEMRRSLQEKMGDLEAQLESKRLTLKELEEEISGNQRG